MRRTLPDALGLRADFVCVVCNAPNALPAGSVAGHRDQLPYDLARCTNCGFVFVVRPRTDFDALYDEAYYRGEGGDPWVRYADELQPSTIRQDEWEGIRRIVLDLCDSCRPQRWLDFGCGYGGLVDHVTRHDSSIEIVGHDGAHPAGVCRDRGLSVLSHDELASQPPFNVITAIEVLEHTVDPVDTLSLLAGLLAPGGLIFLTTGNAQRHVDNFESWSYVAPEVHISFFEPRTLNRLYSDAGLQSTPVGWRPGMREVIKFKVLKSLHVSNRSVVHRLVPWSLVCRLADRREGVSDQPAARLATSPS